MQTIIRQSSSYLIVAFLTLDYTRRTNIHAELTQLGLGTWGILVILVALTCPFDNLTRTRASAFFELDQRNGECSWSATASDS